ncbi:hypothetical protein RvY_17633 [Ramazzottius varieornatus]|uniref:Uncharacterized protein n=1 Tax=Ramazzottius varieornatus TaxID=947166 RepID=A0A1D1W3K4_RAMVA|nr:hypothetical protein RvY_17633 [Ramazzottius varieornatus]
MEPQKLGAKDGFGLSGTHQIRAATLLWEVSCHCGSWEDSCVNIERTQMTTIMSSREYCDGWLDQARRRKKEGKDQGG